jgi:hypothetical protein
MEIFNHALECMVLEFNVMYEISKTHIRLMLFIYFLFIIYLTISSLAQNV